MGVTLLKGALGLLAGENTSLDPLRPPAGWKITPFDNENRPKKASVGPFFLSKFTHLELIPVSDSLENPRKPSFGLDFRLPEAHLDRCSHLAIVGLSLGKCSRGNAIQLENPVLLHMRAVEAALEVGVLLAAGFFLSRVESLGSRNLSDAKLSKKAYPRVVSSMDGNVVASGFPGSSLSALLHWVSMMLDEDEKVFMGRNNALIHQIGSGIDRALDFTLDDLSTVWRAGLKTP